MKAWCQSVFLVALTCTHTKRKHAFSTTSCYSRDRESVAAVSCAWVWWLQPVITYWYSFCHSTLTGFFSHTVLRSPQPLLSPGYRNRHTDWPFPKWVPVLPPTPVLLCLVSLSPSSTSVPAHHPPNLSVVRFVNRGCLRGLETDCVQEHLALW